MVSEAMDLVPTQQRMENGLNSPMVFQEDGLQYCSGSAARQNLSNDPGRKPRPVVGGFVSDKLFAVDQREQFFRIQGAELRRSMYDSTGHPPRDRLESQEWNAHGSTGTQSGDGSAGDEEDDEDDDEDDDDEGDGEVEGMVVADEGNKNNNSSGSVQSSSEKICSNKADLPKQNSSFGPSRRALVKDNGAMHSVNSFRGSLSDHQQQNGRVNHFENAITIAEPDMYYAQMLQAPEVLALAQKGIGGENRCGHGRKDVAFSIESGDSLRTSLSDPITGMLMDDAMILPCGHSFGSVGLQHVLRTKSCHTCLKAVSEDSVSPNLALRLAVQAFRREEELQSSKASKRRRERFEQDKCSFRDQFPTDMSKGKGVQFPFAVTDRVVIRGNKRTPQRFVGREAVVTTQCLNGWYVVKTLDNAESVKLQYRSLAKVPDNPSPNMNASKAITPNWLKTCDMPLPFTVTP